jgi:hypothetical protein
MTPHDEPQFTAGDSAAAFDRPTVFHLTGNVIIDVKNSGISKQAVDYLISTPNSSG